MQPLAGQPYSQQPTPAPQDPNAILNECRDVSAAIDRLDSDLANLRARQSDFLQTGNTSNRDVDSISAGIMASYRELGGKVKRIKSKPEAGQSRNKPQVDALDRKIKRKINDFQGIESAFRKDVQEQQARQYKIVNPNATEAEIREATQDGGDTQIFQQALMNSDRRGQAQSTLRNVQQRHDAIQQIEKTMIELQQLFQDLDAIVVQQEPMVQNIEQKAEETNTHMVAGNTEVGKAVKSARAARKKKWICLGIVGKFEYRSVLYRPALETNLFFSAHHCHHRRRCSCVSRCNQQARWRQRQRQLGPFEFLLYSRTRHKRLILERPL